MPKKDYIFKRFREYEAVERGILWEEDKQFVSILKKILKKNLLIIGDGLTLRSGFKLSPKDVCALANRNHNKGTFRSRILV